MSAVSFTAWGSPSSSADVVTGEQGAVGFVGLRQHLVVGTPRHDGVERRVQGVDPGKKRSDHFTRGDRTRSHRRDELHGAEHAEVGHTVVSIESSTAPTGLMAVTLRGELGSLRLERVAHRRRDRELPAGLLEIGSRYRTAPPSLPCAEKWNVHASP